MLKRGDADTERKRGKDCGSVRGVSRDWCANEARYRVVFIHGSKFVCEMRSEPHTLRNIMATPSIVLNAIRLIISVYS